MALLAFVVVTLAVVGAAPDGRYEMKSILKLGEHKLNTFETKHPGRHLVEADRVRCDASFLKCVDDVTCRSCFRDLDLRQIDWASIPPGTTCAEVIDVLHRSSHCTQVPTVETNNVFCDTFHACAVMNDPTNDNFNNNGDTDDDSDSGRSPAINCTALTTCDWPGIHKTFLGDGICHDNIQGCYNTAICGYDGGDCCKDTCENYAQFNHTSKNYECGHDGYVCKDPRSSLCDSKLTTQCPAHVQPDHQDKQKLPFGDKPCRPDQAQYRVMMYDAFGDGWDKTTMLTITPTDNSYDRVFAGTLEDGAKSMEYACLSRNATCYRADVSGGTWGAEVSWDVRPMRDGLPEIAAGGAPMRCEFGVAGATCANTCKGRDGKPPPTDDPEYRTFKKMSVCIEEKCLIQLQQCKKDSTCAACFTEKPPAYCMQLEHFNAVVDCAMCSCTERKESEFCKAKVRPDRIEPVAPPDSDGQNVIKQCTGAETMQGSKAVMDFSECSEFGSVEMMVTKFNNSNFGQLDKFEECAHNFKRGVGSALSCMNMLKRAIDFPLSDPSPPDAPTDAIKALASELYNDSENYCDCATTASKECPQCPSFENFKVLTYEILDSCLALDEIDCAAWKEFAPSCNRAITEKFGSLNFADKAQCHFVKEGCGGVGAFAFRRVDCAAKNEVPKASWDMFTSYSNNCLGADVPPVTPPVAPPVTVPTGTPPITPPYSPPEAAPYSAPVPSPTKKPYISPDDKKGSSSHSDTKPKRKSHFWKWFFFLCIVGGVGYWYYKHRSNAFNFGRYRPASQFDGGSEMMYGNLNSSTNFEPPMLSPPSPQNMMGSMMNSMGMGSSNNFSDQAGGYSNMQGSYTGPGMT